MVRNEPLGLLIYYSYVINKLLLEFGQLIRIPKEF